MNSVEFEVRLNKIFESLFQSGFLQNVKSWNFSSAELAQIQVQLCQVATQTALNLQELDYKKQQVAMEQEKMRQELEMAISRFFSCKCNDDLRPVNIYLKIIFCKFYIF